VSTVRDGIEAPLNLTGMQELGSCPLPFVACGALSGMVSGCSVALLACVRDRVVVLNRMATHVAE